MSKHIINAGATSQRFYIYLQDSTTGQGETSVVAATCYYLRDSVSGSMPAAVTLTFGAVFASPGTYPAWSSGAVREIGYMPGLYLIDIPDAVFAAGARNAVVQIFPTTGTPWLPVNLEFTLSAANIYDSVRMGMTALPNTAVTTNGSLITSGSGTDQLSVTTGNVAVGSIANNAITAASINADAITAAKIADSAITIRLSSDATASEARLIAGTTASDVWNALETSITTTSSIGVKVKNNLNDTITSRMASFTYTAPPSTADIWNTNISGYTTAGFAGTYLKNAMPTFTYTAPLTSTQTAQSVWNALLADYTTVNTFGARIVRTRSTSPSNEVTITGSFHIAADVHEIQPATITAADFAAGAIDANALATDAVTEIASGAWNYDISAISMPGQAGRYITDIKVDTTNISSSVTTIEAVAYRQSIADYLLGRNLAGGSDGGRTVRDALRALRNKSEIVGTTLTVYAENDTTSAWTATVSSSASADPVTGIDPA